MLANPLTKIESDGTLSWKDLRATLMEGAWQPSRAWLWNGLPMGPNASRVSFVFEHGLYLPPRHVGDVLERSLNVP